MCELHASNYSRTSFKRPPIKRPPSIKQPLSKVPNYFVSYIVPLLNEQPLLSGQFQSPESDRLIEVRLYNVFVQYITTAFRALLSYSQHIPLI